jgi:hypothetical protein
MWQVLVFCSGCIEEAAVVVDDLDSLDQRACPCGYSYVVLSIATFEPVYSERSAPIELPECQTLPLAA